MDLQIIAECPRGEQLEVSIPPGDYWIGDPCYVLPERLYRDLHSLEFRTPGDMVGRDMHLATPNGHYFHCGTAYGDGRYSMNIADPRVCTAPTERELQIPVDTGRIALIDKRMVEQNPEEDFTKFMGQIRLKKSLLVTTKDGNFDCDLFSIITDGSDDKDDEEYYDDEEDEDDDPDD